MNDLKPRAAIEEELRGNGISVESISLGESVSLVYLTSFPDVQPDHGEVGRAVKAFLELSEGEWDPKTVEATILRSDDDVQATWTLEAEWIRGYNEYRLDDYELTDRVLDSIESEDAQ
ncbi:hypothetical protein ACFQJC_02060 [Haloferax namakaokahaiae]|uniref:DUF8159 domain-containing protein n=1 Tax=Haloferax namakaokahaiae TaxID=1748331 RepID=A0ABD5ZAH2_9EURY